MILGFGHIKSSYHFQKLRFFNIILYQLWLENYLILSCVFMMIRSCPAIVPSYTCKNALEISIVATSYSSFASITDVSKTISAADVGILTSS